MTHSSTQYRFVPGAAVVIAALLNLPLRLSGQATSIVVPASASKVDGNRWMNSHFRERYPRRIQVLLGAKHFEGIVGKRITELALRKDVKLLTHYKNLRGAEATRMRVVASFSSADPARPSLYFAENHATQATEVYVGDVILPKVASKDSRVVATFDASEAPRLRFQTPLLVEAGKTLVIDFFASGGKANYEWSWPVDAVTVFHPGSIEPLGRPSWPTTWGDTVKVVRGSLRPGMHIKVDSAAPPSPFAGFVVYGFSDKLALGTLPLPLLLAAPKSFLYVSPDVIGTAVFYQGQDAGDEGWAGATVATPQDQALYGASLYFQFIFMHQTRSGLGLAAGGAAKLTFTKEVPSLEASLVAARDTTTPRGRVFLDFTPVLEFVAK